VRKLQKVIYGLNSTIKNKKSPPLIQWFVNEIWLFYDIDKIHLLHSLPNILHPLKMINQVSACFYHGFYSRLSVLVN